MTEPNVLFVSPNQSDAVELAEILADASMVLEHVRCLDDASTRLKAGRHRVVLTEARLEDAGWEDVFTAVLHLQPSARVIVTDAFADVGLWSEALNVGAFDVLAQPFDRTEVVRIVSSAAGLSALPAKCAAASYFG